MLEVPAFKPHWRAVAIGDEGVILLSEAEKRTILDNVRAKVASKINGKRSSDEIVRILSDTVDPVFVWSQLLKLEKEGLIEESETGRNKQSDAFWLTLGQDPDAVAVKLASGEVRVFSEAQALAVDFEKALHKFGISSTGSFDLRLALESHMPLAKDSKAGLDIVLVRDYLCNELISFNNGALLSGRSWMLARPYGATIWIGPLFGLENRGCLDCMRQRLRQLLPAHRLAESFDPERGLRQPLGSLPGTEALANHMTAMEVVKVFAGIESGVDDSILTLDLRDFSSRRHRLLIHPGCDVCGAASPKGPAPLKLKRQQVTNDGDGGFRTVPPEETLRAFNHLISPITGIVGSLIPDTYAKDAGRSFVAEEIIWFEPKRISHLIGSLRSSSLGKGMSDAQAKASALCEAAERYSGCIQGTEIKRRATFNELACEAIHPNDVMNFSDLQYENRLEWNERHKSGFHFIPRRLDPDQRLDWTPVWSLSERRHKYLPTELLYYDRSLVDREHLVAVGCSNGAAAGNSIEEAILQGLFEVVERDAVAMWWYNKLRRPPVDMLSFDDLWLANARKQYRELGRELAVVDLTNDLGIPVFAAFSYYRDREEESITIGYGCHLDPRIAIQRAMTETCQMLYLEMRGDRSAVEIFGDGWMIWAKTANETYILPDESAAAKTRDHYPDLEFDDIFDCIEYCRGLFEARGMELLVLDQTRADIRVPVAKVVVPGLRHFWPRFGPGRLYEVPVEMGWLGEKLTESELNPIPIFF